MSLQNVEMNSAKVTFDKEKTREYRTDMNNPCDCQNCRNYYKHIKNKENPRFSPGSFSDTNDKKDHVVRLGLFIMPLLLSCFFGLFVL